MILSDILASKFQQQLQAAKECTIVINGELVAKGTVYASYSGKDGDHPITYYTKTKEESIIEKVAYPEAKITKLYSPDRFLGMAAAYQPTVTVDNLKVEVDTDLKIIFVETYLYTTIRNLIKSNSYKDATLTIQSRNTQLTNQNVQELVAHFKEKSYINFLNTIFTPKFMSRILRYNRETFYTALHAFIPILIECKYLYNPLVDNPELRFKETLLYRYAMERNRVKSILPEDTLTVTLATHAEICKCLYMDKFMRFTPNFLYRLLVGFYAPSGITFPNVSTKIWATEQTTNASNLGLQATYGKFAYEIAKDKCRQDIAANKNEDTVNKAKTKLSLLESYVESDSLWFAINNERLKLTHYGTFCLDTKENCTTSKLYSYLSVAKLYAKED